MPLQLTVEHESGSRRGHRDFYDRESILIGRGDRNDVALDPFEDATVSVQHAEIRLENGTAILYDMGSLNGTFLNGMSVRRAELHEGDEISLGRQGPRLRVALGQVGGASHGPKRVRMPVQNLDVGKTAPEGLKTVDLEPEGRSWGPRSPLVYILVGGAIVGLLIFAFKLID